MVDEGTEGLIALSGGRHGDVGCRARAGNMCRRRARCGRVVRVVPQRYYLEVQRAGFPDDDSLVAATVASLASLRACRWWPRIPVQFATREVSARTRRASSIAEGPCCPTRGGRGVHDDQYFKTQAGDGGEVRGPARGARQHVAIAQRCNLTIPLGKNTCRVPDARGRHDRPGLRNEARRPSSGGSSPSSRPRCATRSGLSMWRASSSRWRPSCRWASPVTS